MKHDIRHLYTKEEFLAEVEEEKGFDMVGEYVEDDEVLMRMLL